MVGVLMVLIHINPLTLDEHDSNPPCFHGSPKFAPNKKPRRYCTPSRNTGSVASIQMEALPASYQTKLHNLHMIKTLPISAPSQKSTT